MSEMDIIDEILEDAAEGAAEDILQGHIIDKEQEQASKDRSEEKQDEQTAKPEAPEQEKAQEEAEDKEPAEEPAKEDTAETQDAAEDASAEKKGFFGKKKEKHDKKDEKIAELTDRLQRSLAEFNNYRNRTDKEKAAMYEIGARSVIEKILPVVDNFERGLAAVPEAEKDSSFAAGMDMIYKQLQKTLTDLGVSEIEAAGREFDPNLHNAVMHEENDELGENVVTEVFQKGYTYHDNVIRHAMVKVAN